MKAGSAKYGACEVCGNNCDTTYLQVETRDYAYRERGMDGQWEIRIGRTHHECYDLFGHRDCLVSRQRLPDGWTEASPGGLMCNPDPTTGGIIDTPILPGKWFVVFNRPDLPLLDGYDTRDDAHRAFLKCLKENISEHE